MMERLNDVAETYLYAAERLTNVTEMHLYVPERLNDVAETYLCVTERLTNEAQTSPDDLKLFHSTIWRPSLQILSFKLPQRKKYGNNYP
ncbi:MAG: hypothetical protein ACTHJ5_05955 [Ilyomonas sp.]